MGHQYAAIAFTEQVKQVQVEQNSRAGYAPMDEGEDFNYLLSEREAHFISQRDSFYMASVSETDWPYVQHRGGPAGFLRVLDEKTLAFADFKGNRQYISTGNFRKNDRVSLILMDYPNRTRLKVLGRVSMIPEDDWETLASLESEHYRANVERGFLIHIEAFDWNCPQHITPRYTDEDIQQLIAPLEKENNALKAQLTTESATNNTSLNNTAPNNSALTNRILGNGPMPLIISGVRQLTPRVRAYELRDPNGLELPAITAGAHLAIPVEIDNETPALRHYSICSNPARRDIYEIAVLLEEEGTGGSKAIHKKFQLGQRLNCDYPTNHFALHNSHTESGSGAPAVLLAGGIGITPIKSIAQSLTAKGVDLTIHYAGRNKTEMAFSDRLERTFKDNLFIYSSADNQRMNVDSILANAPANAVFYICGPNNLITTVVKSADAQQIPSDRVSFERFTSKPSDQAKPITLTLARSNKTVEVRSDQTVLDAMLNADVAIPYNCKTGDCKSCAVEVIEGEPEHHDNALSKAEKTGETGAARTKGKKLMCPCVSRATSDHLVLNI